MIWVEDQGNKDLLSTGSKDSMLDLYVSSPIQNWARELNRFSKEDMQMANKHMKRCPVSLIIREMQIKTTVRYHLMSLRMTIIKVYKQQMLERCGENGTLLYCWWECNLVQPLWRTVWRFLKKLGIELPYNPASHCWAYILRKPELKETRAPQCSSQHCCNSQDMEAT